MIDCLADILDPEVMELFTPPKGGSFAAEGSDTRRAITSSTRFDGGRRAFGVR